ncbi:MAG: ABC transporter permease [Rhodanobacter sp.]|nr:MAG: ABC transporter permease [Rhodanobacter sp.]
MDTLINFIIVQIKLTFRIKAAFFFTIAFPMIFYGVYVLGIGQGDGSEIMPVLAALITFVTVSNSIFGVVLPLIMSRENGLFKQYYLTPVNPWQILVARMLTSFIVLCIVLAIQIVLTAVLFGSDLWQKIPSIFIVALLGSLAISSIGCLVSCLIDSVQAAQIANQITFIVLIVFSGATVPLRYFPHAAVRLFSFLPSTQLFKAMTGVLVGDETLRGVRIDLLGLLFFTLFVFGASLFTFRWDSRTKVGMVAISSVFVASICALVVDQVLPLFVS